MSPAATTLPHDPVLPRLAAAFDEGLMAEAFTDALQGRGTRVEVCRLERVKYQPLRNCTLSYRLWLRDLAAGHLFEQRVAARVCSGSDTARRAARAGVGPLSASLAGPAVRLLPALDMLTWWWPNDAKLGAPRVLADPALLQAQVLPPVVAALSGGRGSLLEHEVQIVQYVPEQRLTARVSLRWREGGLPVERQVYAKASREPDGATVYGYLAALQCSAAWRERRLRTPEAVLWQDRFGLQWQEAMPGRAWLDLSPAHQSALAATLGAQLAALHATPIASAPGITAGGMRERLHEAAEVLGRVLPPMRQTLGQVVAGLDRALDALDDAPAATLHGDLHPRNILVDGDRLALIDLDGLRRGPALLELGAWIADGMYRALLADTAPMRDAAAWRTLFDAYARAGGTRVDARSLAVATAWNLIAPRARRCVINLKPGRLAIAPRLVALAAELLHGDGRVLT